VPTNAALVGSLVAMLDANGLGSGSESEFHAVPG